MNAAARTGIDPTSFEMLPCPKMASMVDAMLAHSAIVGLADVGRSDPRGKLWLNILFAAAHAAFLGAPGVRDMALAWSKTSPRFAGEADFDVAWNSFNPFKPGGITIGTLIGKARDSGFDVSRWFREDGGSASTVPQNTAHSAFLQGIAFDASDLTEPPWLIHGMLLHGDLTVWAAPGGGAKTAAAVSYAVAMTAGHTAHLGRSIHPREDGQSHRVLFVSAEEDGNRMALLIAAASVALNLTPTERAAVRANIVLHDARRSGFRIGAPREDHRETVCPEAHDHWLSMLEQHAAGFSLIVIDTLAACFNLPNENDNSAVTDLLRRVMKLAGRIGCAVLILHHMAKMSREAAAANRGEPTGVRGGGAITNTARIVWTITGLPIAEAAAFALGGTKAENVRRFDATKINDAPPPDPVLFEVVGIPIQVASGKTVQVRAIAPLPGSGGVTGALSPALLNTAMRAIDAGCEVHGRLGVPLSMKSADRNAVDHVAAALRRADPNMTDAVATAAAKAALNHLVGTIECVRVEEVKVPKAPRDGGGSKGSDTRQGLRAIWSLASWPEASATPGVIAQASSEPAPSTPAEASFP